jgi:3-hydroxyisobutyrate dehydrogenase-like beta-hydroxyacid dehydrogenase
MAIKTIGLLSPGDMGNVVAKVLQSHGLRVLTCLIGCSERTRMLAREAHIEAVPTYEDLVAESEMLLSIVVPEAAPDTARLVAEALRRAGKTTTYVDCNAVSPETVKAIAAVIASSAVASPTPASSGHPRDSPASPASMPQDLRWSTSSNSRTSAWISDR